MTRQFTTPHLLQPGQVGASTMGRDIFRYICSLVVAVLHVALAPGELQPGDEVVLGPVDAILTL